MEAARVTPMWKALAFFLAFGFLGLPSMGSPILNEVMAVNRSTLKDEAGEFQDWLEVYNDSNEAIDLGGMYLSDDPDDLTKWSFPITNAAFLLPAKSTLILWLDGQPEQGYHHAPFRLDANGAVLLLSKPDGKSVLDKITLPAQYADVSYGRASNGAEWRYLAKPTPGTLNESSGVTDLGIVTFSKSSGVFVDSFALSLSTTSAGLSIRYTTDGKLPEFATSLPYEQSIAVERTLTVRASLFLNEQRIGPVVSNSYIAIDPALRGFSSNLPIVVMDSAGYNFARDSRLGTDFPPKPVASAFFETEVGERTDLLLSPPTHTGRVGLNVRGASSREWPKKHYKLETWGEADEDKAVSLLGMPEDADWILGATYFDRSLMRDVLIFDWWRALGYYSPRTRFVELFLSMDNGQRVDMGDYQGVYVLTEKIKRGEDRVDIEPISASDNTVPAITGGYLLQSTNIDQHFTTRRGVYIKYVDPKQQEPLTAQKAWIRKYLDDFEAALFGTQFKDPQNGYRKYIDVSSHIDYDIFREFSRNIDGASTFFYVDRGEKLKMGPLWDYNQSLGMTSLFASDRGWETAGWNEAYMTQAGIWPKWWMKMDDDPDYQMTWQDRWVQLRESVLTDARLLGDIDSTAALLEEAQERNFERWKVLGKAIWVTGGASRAAPGEKDRDTYAKEVAWMRDWLAKRLKWIDQQVPAPPDLSTKSGALDRGAVIAMQPGAGFKPLEGGIHLTLDGSDPRLTGGEINPQAVLYQAPLKLENSTVIKARSRSASGVWSALREAKYVIAQTPSAQNLVISEIHYNPAGSDETEFLELSNRGSTPVNLTGLKLAGGLDFTFGLSDLAPGASVVVVENEKAFRRLHPEPAKVIAGTWRGALSNGGETIRMLAAEGAGIAEIEYDDSNGWPSSADGAGSSLELTSLSADPKLSGSWKASTQPGGTPGSFTLTSSYDDWKKSALSQVESNLQAHAADPDRDGLPNLMEYALGSNPLSHNSGGILVAKEATQQAVTIRLVRSTSANVRFFLEHSDDLETWRRESLPDALERAPLLDGTERISFRSNLTSQTAFLRLVVELSP